MMLLNCGCKTSCKVTACTFFFQVLNVKIIVVQSAHDVAHFLFSGNWGTANAAKLASAADHTASAREVARITAMSSDCEYILFMLTH